MNNANTTRNTNAARNTNRTVLISGASIAGPALAYWLGRHGFEPTVVELAPALREGARPSTSAVRPT